ERSPRALWEEGSYSLQCLDREARLVPLWATAHRLIFRLIFGTGSTPWVHAALTSSLKAEFLVSSKVLILTCRARLPLPWSRWCRSSSCAPNKNPSVTYFSIGEM